ncbi:MAG: hypothetical protein QGI41_09065, partial [Acidimicrobiales bacterium]|nr:hypothetical protein [Acidimicrobiales bacterium]
EEAAEAVVPGGAVAVVVIVVVPGGAAVVVGGVACSALRIVRLVGGMAGSLSIFRNGARQ